MNKQKRLGIVAAATVVFGIFSKWLVGVPYMAWGYFDKKMCIRDRVNTKELHADYKYESVYSNHKTKTAYHVVKEWLEEVKNQKSEKDMEHG